MDVRAVRQLDPWEATGPIEVDTNTTTFPGFVGHFVGQHRDAVATGVALDGR